MTPAQSLLAQLHATQPTFREHWARDEVDTRRSAVKPMHHPERGWLDFDVEMLHDPERDHWIMLYTPREND